jgi:hypothetical protein
MRRIQQLGITFDQTTTSQNVSIDSRHGHEPHNETSIQNRSLSMMLEEMSKEEFSESEPAPKQPSFSSESMDIAIDQGSENWLVRKSLKDTKDTEESSPVDTNTPPFSPLSS